MAEKGKKGFQKDNTGWRIRMANEYQITEKAKCAVAFREFNQKFIKQNMKYTDYCQMWNALYSDKNIKSMDIKIMNKEIMVQTD